MKILSKILNFVLQKKKSSLAVSELSFSESDVDISYILDGNELILPNKHPLPEFQKKYYLYDKFLPVLVGFLPENKMIIDVGANVGDTLFACIEKTKNDFVCIEPSEIFYNYLDLNTKKLSKENQDRIKILKTMVGTGSFQGDLNMTHGGTATLVVDKNINMSFSKLDDLIVDQDSVGLIKVDTDGYDFDVLNSAINICKASEPIIFWENEISEDYQYDGYSKLYLDLANIGYNTIYIFDNFGNIILERSNFEQLSQLNKYIYSMRKFNCTRTIFYTDVLVCTPKNLHIVEKAIKLFQNDFINIFKN